MEMLAYLSKFIPNMAEEPAPLRRLLEKNVQWHWSDEHQKKSTLLKNSTHQSTGGRKVRLCLFKIPSVYRIVSSRFHHDEIYVDFNFFLPIISCPLLHVIQTLYYTD
jgi:hypothetical protein